MKCERNYNIGESNPMFGKKHSLETIEKMRLVKLADNNPIWKGYDYKFKNPAMLHRWVRRRLPKPELCPICRLKPPLDLANINNMYNPETYTRDLNNWIWLCRSCHMKTDGRINNLKNQGVK